jgi:hypothetical protein
MFSGFFKYFPLTQVVVDDGQLHEVVVEYVERSIRIDTISQVLTQ